MHKIVVAWSETAFPTSAEALSVTRMSLVDSAKALGVSEPNVEQFETRSGELRTVDEQAFASADLVVATNGAVLKHRCGPTEGSTVLIVEPDPAVPPEGFDDGFDQTTDPLRWAEAFMQRVKAGVVVDAGFMLGWFANAISAGERASRPRHHDETLDGVLVATPDQHEALPVPLDHGFHVVSEPGRHFDTRVSVDGEDREHLVVREVRREEPTAGLGVTL